MNFMIMVLRQHPVQFGSWSENSPKSTPQTLHAGLSHPTPPTSLSHPRPLCLSCYGPLCIWKMFCSIRLDIKPFPLYFFCCDASSLAAILIVSITTTDSTELFQSFHQLNIQKQDSILHSVKFLWRVVYRGGIYDMKTVRLGSLDATKSWHRLDFKGCEMWISFFNYWVLNEHTIICQSRGGLDSFTWRSEMGVKSRPGEGFGSILNRDGCFVYVETTVSRMKWDHTQTVQIQPTTLVQVVFLFFFPWKFDLIYICEC